MFKLLASTATGLLLVSGFNAPVNAVSFTNSTPVNVSSAVKNISLKQTRSTGGIYLTLSSAKIKNLPVDSGTTNRVLNRKVAGHYKGTALPGQVGNFAVAGHRVSHGGVFEHLDKVRKKNKIYVRTVHFTYVYKVVKIKVVGPKNSRPLTPVPYSQSGKVKGAWATLTTCTPKGSTKKRLIITAKYVGVK